MQVLKRVTERPDGQKKTVFVMSYTHPGTRKRIRQVLSGAKTKGEAEQLAAACWERICSEAEMV